MADKTDIELVVLLAEDRAGDVRLIQEAFRSVNKGVRLHIASDGKEAMAFLQREGEYATAPRPDLILLDLNMPRMSGHEVLAQIKREKTLRKIPTLILSTTEAESDVSLSYGLQANCHLRKPGHWDALLDLVTAVDAIWLSKVRLPPHTLPVVA
jgi:two-component system, chemotaxis family, response regulator Rcp1